MGKDLVTTVDTEAGPVQFSKDGKYRYTLHRRWQDGPVVNFIMLNPSTADGNRLDPTLRRCRTYAMAWGYGGFAITNLFAYRSAYKLVLRRVDDPVGPENDHYIVEQAQQADLVVCGWGTDGKLHGRSNTVVQLLKTYGIALHYIRLTREGQPGHPLYLPSELKPSVWC